MLKIIRPFALSVFFLLYTEGLLHANTHYSFQGADDFAPAPGLLYSDVLQPLPGPTAAAPPPPELDSAAKNPAPPAEHRRPRAKSAPAPGRKPKEPAPSSQPVNASNNVNILRDEYRDLTGRELFITSTGRTPRRQAVAMYDNFVEYGSTRVVAHYRNKRAAREIAEAFEANRHNPGRAISAMTAVITRQVNDGTFVSNHLRGKAVDLRVWGPQRARLKPLRQIAQSRGWRVLVEASHVHVDLS